MTAINANMLKHYFHKVDSVVWDLSTCKTGIQTGNGIATFDLTPAAPALAATATTPAVDASPASGTININPFDSFGMTLPAFAIATPFEKIEVGDLVHGANNILGWVVRKTGAALFIHKADGHVTQYAPPNVNLLGSGDNSVKVVKSLGSMLGGEQAVGNLSNSLMPLLLLGDSLGDMEDMLPLLLLGNNNGAVNPMLLMAIMGKKKGSTGSGLFDDPLMLMMLMGGGGGLFGGGTGNGGGLGGMNPLVLSMLMSAKSADRPVAAPPLVRSNTGLPPLRRTGY